MCVCNEERISIEKEFISYIPISQLSWLFQSEHTHATIIATSLSTVAVLVLNWEFGILGGGDGDVYNIMKRQQS